MPFFRLLTAFFAVAALVGCGGGGGVPGTTPAAVVPALSEIRTANPRALQDAAGNAAVNSVRDSASASFDGTHVQVQIQRTDGSRLTLDSTTDRTGTTVHEAALPGYTFRGDGLAKVIEGGVAFGEVHTNWNNSDSTDFIAGGFWATLDGSINPLRVTSAEMGAFVDGPEIRSAPSSMPDQGIARYTGQAAGFYAYVTPTLEQVGRFSSEASLTANFANSTISGCVGCSRGIYVEGIGRFRANPSQTVPIPIQRTDYRLLLGPTSFNSSGEFSGQNVNLRSTVRTVTSTRGSWDGGFSNISSSSGDPRLAAGTGGARWTESDGSEGVFVGSWFGTLN